ncbi:MAG: peptide ligase PGM1-related protein [Actinomycetota bacterium]
MAAEQTSSGPSFEERQAALVSGMGARDPTDMTTGTLVVLPSITFPEEELRKIIGIQYYEERLLFLLLLLRNPDLRIVYVTSIRVEEPIVDYYLGFVPPETRPGDRLYLIALWDAQQNALTEKLLDRPEALERMSVLAEDACLVPFNVTDLEVKVAEATGIPLYGCPPDLVHLGFKSGSRKVAREAGVPVLSGAEDLFSVDEVLGALEDLKATGARSAVIKLNEGFSGQGNAVVDLDTLCRPLASTATVFCASEESWPSFERKITQGGAVVERFVRGPGVVSPSVQMRIAPDGSCEVVSTHDQILGGPDDQVYLGCRFPASSDYRLQIQELGERVGKVLAAKGVIGPFGIDFIIVPGEAGREIYLSEINLRMGGTTHPFLMAKLVTEGTYDPVTGELVADGRSKHYISTDNLKSESHVGSLPEEVIAALDRAGLGFDRVTHTGTTLHLLGAVKKHGKIGVLCIADSVIEADAMYNRVLDELGEISSG